MVVAISMSAMLGSGIFVLPGLAAAMTGPSAWLAYLFAGVCILPAALSKAELATAMPTSGGTYVFIERTFGPLVGTIAGLGLWLSLVLKSSFALVGFSAYWAVLLEELDLRPVAILLLTLIVALNIGGVRKVAKVQIWSVAVALVTLTVLLIPGLLSYKPALLENSFQHGKSGFFAATAFVFLSYAGVTKIAAISEEVSNPSRNLPLGMLISLGTVMVVYTGLVFVLVGNLSPEQLHTNLHPIYTLADHLLGPVVGWIAAIVGIATMAGMANSGMLAASRFPYAMGRDRLLPSAFNRVHQRFKTPVTSIVVTGLIMALIIWFVEIEKIVKVGSAFQILMFCGVNAAVILLRVTGVQWYKPNYLSPLYPGMQIFGILSGIVLLYQLGQAVLPAIAAIIVIGAVLFALYGRKRTDRQGVLRLYGRRVTLLLRSSLSPREGRMLPNWEGKSIHKVFPAFAHGVEADRAESENAAVVVPLLGSERTPEMLVEVGAALADGEKVEVVQITEVPEQTLLDAMSEDDVMVDSLHRRIGTMAEREQFHAHFEAVVTHDIIKTVNDINERTHAEWLVMEWKGSLSHSIFFHNPVGWIVSHLTCNLALLKDAGIRYIRKILVYCEPGPDEHLVAATADHLASIYKAELTFVGVLPTVHSKEERQKLEDYLQDLQDNCATESTNVLLTGDIKNEAIISITGEYDLLVAGSPKRAKLGLRIRSALLGVSTDSLTSDSACSVLRLRTPRPKRYPDVDQTTLSNGGRKVNQ